MKKRYWIPAAILAVLCVGCLGLLLKHTMPTPAPKPPPTITPTVEPSPSPTQIPETAAPTDAFIADATPSPEPTPEVTPEPYVSPIDFETLQSGSPDIYAWLDIPGTEISYPVLQHATDDTFYLNRDEFGKSSDNGSLFSEHVYNSKDFTDPVTLIYGHHKWYGAMFGELQNIYSDPEQFEDLNEFIIYLPEREIHYEVFAAIPYDAIHILYTYDFTSARNFRYFFDDVLNTRVLGSNVISDYELQYDDHIVILSTCFAGNNKRRFLVMGKELAE